MTFASATSARPRRLWLFALLPVLHWAICFTAARTIRAVGSYDTAYYYVIARNIGQGRGLTDTVLWQFLGTPESVQRPAGAYWDVGWPLVLGALMRVFGHSQHAAILLSAAISVLMPLATALVAYLAGKRAGPAWLAGLLVCLQARLLPANISPDATFMYQIACLSGMAAFLWARERDLTPRRLAAVGAALAFPMYVRGEGFVVGAAALLLLLFAGGRPVRESFRRTLWVALGMALFSLPFTLRNLVVFGHLVPESRSLRLWMTTYNDLYSFASDPSPAAFWAQGTARLVGLRRDALVAHLENLAGQIPWPLLPLSAVGALAHARSRRTWVLPLFLALSLLVPCLVVPLIASVDRFVMNVLPVLCVMASLGIFALRDGVARVVRSRIVDAAVIGVGVWACVTVFRGALTVQAHIDNLRWYRDTPAFLADGQALAPLHLTPGDVVLTDEPWRVAAVLDVTTVMCPLDGPAAVDALVEKYRPRFVIATSPALKRLVSAKRFDLRRVATMRDGAWYELQGSVRNADSSARVTDASPPP